MASPITTGGFQIQERLNPQYADPRLLTPRYDQIIPAIGQGLGVANQYNVMADQARQSPIRDRLQQLQLQAAEQKAALSPLEAQRRRFELSQPIERVIGGGVEEVNRYPQIETFSDDGAFRTIKEQPAGIDVFSTENVEVVDPQTGEKQVITRRVKPITTMEQAAAQADMADYRDQLAAAGSMRAEAQTAAAQAKADNDRLKAEATMLRAQQALSDTKWKVVSSSLDPEGNLVINQVNSQGELRSIPTGQRRSLSELEQLMNSVANHGGATAPAAPAFGSRVDGILSQNGNIAAPAAAAPAYTDANSVKAAFRSGTINRAQAEKILREQFGMK